MASLYIFVFILATAAVFVEAVDYRLPQIYETDNYKLDLTILPEAFTNQSNAYTGTVTIKFKFTKDAETVSLHAHHEYISLKSVTYNNIILQKDDYGVDNETDILTITLTSPVNIGTTYTLIIDFEGTLGTTEFYGFYKSSYVDKGGKTKYLALTQFEPIHARRAFPCFDEPSFKATYDVSITHPTDLNVLFNTPLINTTAIPNTGLTKDLFVTTPKQSTYLTAFIVSEFSYTEAGKVSGVTYRVWSRNETSELRHLAADVGPKVLTHLNAFTNYDFNQTNTKLDLVAIPDFAAGAMENWGLITYRDVDLLWDEKESSNQYKQLVATVIAHETSHQWFGDLVTLQWWSDLFLNEGFATWFEFHLPHEIYPAWELDKQFLVSVVQPVLDKDELENRNPLEFNVSSPTEISGRFDDVSYDKGGSILRMISHFMGQEHFREGLQLYLSNKKFGSALPEDVVAALSEHITDDVKLPTDLLTVLTNWIVEPGYPLLSVEYNGNNVTVSQKRLLKSGKQDDTKWYVPISYTTSEDSDKFKSTTPKAWLTPEKNLTINYPDKAKWIILNNQQTGFYRVNYDDTLWDNIKDALKEKDFGGIIDLNRAQIVDDLFSLAKIGKKSYKDVFGITSFLTDDTSYYSWYPAFLEYDFLLTRVGQNSELGNSVKKSLMDLMDNLYKSVPFVTQKPDDQIYTLKQSLALTWACKLGHDDCVDNARKQFSAYVTTKKRPDKNLRSVVYCNGLRYNGSKTDWGFLWKAYTAAADLVTEQITILTALGCTKDTELLKEYLQKTITKDSGIRTQDNMRVFAAVYRGNPEGVAVAYDFLTENYEKIAESYQSMNSLGNMIKGIADKFTTEEEVNKLRDFTSKENLPEEFKNAAKEALETAEANQKWLTENEALLKDYFNSATQLSASLFAILLAVLINQIISS